MTDIVSVVIPARNAAEFVGSAIESVLGQTYPSIEIAVVDDGSDDATSAVAIAVGGARVNVFRTEGLGVSAARNLGLRWSSGTYIAFLDADDLWLPEKIAEQVAVLETDPECVLVGSLMRYESARGRVLGVAGHVVGQSDQERIKKGDLMPFPLSSMLFRKAAFDKLGEFDVEFPLAQDLELVARAARIGAIRGIRRVLGVYRIHGASASARHFYSQHLAARYISDRLAARETGGDLSWAEFVGSRLPTLRWRYGVLAKGWYRRAGLHVADGHWLRGFAFGTVALALNPYYVVKRVFRQQSARLFYG